MKPEHREWVGRIWELLDQSAAAVLTPSAGPLSS